jgi:glycosyltransferase involved in cell wall biosynthesis
MTAASPHPLHILTLATLFPNAAQPNFGIFVERQTAELARRDGVAVTVVNPIGLPPWPLTRRAPYAALADLPLHEQWRGLNVHRPRFTLIPKLGGARNPASIARALLPLIRRIHAQRPIDLIDAEFFYPDGPAAMHLAEAIAVPFTIKARGADIHYWGAQRGCTEQILAAAQAAAGLLAVSAALRADMAALGIDPNKIRVHYTGLDQSRFRPSDQSALRAELGIDGALLISHGALIARKNQALTIAALPELPDVQLLLAGSGPEEANYRALAARLGVADRVHFLGNVPHDDLPRYLAAADVSVLVSQSEGLANAWVEALACGTPVIISAAGGARELLTDPVAGRIVDPNSSAIVAAVRAILADPPPPQAVAATVRHFRWQANGDQLFSFFRDICGLARPS